MEQTFQTVLVTGFAPFDGQPINPSWEAVRQLPDRIGSTNIHKLLLPVEYANAADAAYKAAQEHQVDAIVSIGQAGGRDAVTPEVIGINLREARIADNRGKLAQGEPILEAAPAAYFSTLPVRAMVQAIQDKDIPAKLSYSAGAYVCNDVLYTLLHRFDGTPVRVGFIHVPFFPSQGTPSLEPEKIIAALEAAITAL